MMMSAIITHQMKKNIKSSRSQRKRKRKLHLKRKRRKNALKNNNKKLGIILMDLMEMMIMKK